MTRNFTVRNRGILPVIVNGFEINGRQCGDIGFTIDSCDAFTLQPNRSQTLMFTFRPDFSSSFVRTELKVLTAEVGCRRALQWRNGRVTCCVGTTGHPRLPIGGLVAARDVGRLQPPCANADVFHAREDRCLLCNVCDPLRTHRYVAGGVFFLSVRRGVCVRFRVASASSEMEVVEIERALCVEL